MIDAPFFSVVIPLYNRAEIIVETVRSVLSQTWQDFEVIVVDDGSADHPEQAMATITDPRVRLIRQENSGGSIARNTGIEAARGQYIAFLDSDDSFLPEKLARAAAACKATQVEVYYNYAKVDRGQGVYGIKPNRPLAVGERVDEFLFCAGETMQTSTLVVRADIARKVMFTPRLAKGQDLDFVVRLEHAGARFEVIPEALTVWTDATYQGRVSHKRHGETLRKWIESVRGIISPAAYYGFLANVLSFEIAKDRPFAALRMIVMGPLRGRTPPKRMLHSLARAFVPRGFYRRLVDLILSKKTKA